MTIGQKLVVAFFIGLLAGGFGVGSMLLEHDLRHDRLYHTPQTQVTNDYSNIPQR